MKKKAIEKVPYLTLPEISRSRKVKFITVTAFKNVGHERKSRLTTIITVITSCGMLTEKIRHPHGMTQ